MGPPRRVGGGEGDASQPLFTVGGAADGVEWESGAGGCDEVLCVDGTAREESDAVGRDRSFRTGDGEASQPLLTVSAAGEGERARQPLPPLVGLPG